MTRAERREHGHRTRARMAARAHSVVCAACGKSLESTSFLGWEYEPYHVKPCKEHPDFGLCLRYDAQGELAIVRMRKVEQADWERLFGGEKYEAVERDTSAITFNGVPVPYNYFDPIDPKNLGIEEPEL